MLVAGLACTVIAGSQQVEPTLWTHWAAEKNRRECDEDAIKRFEAVHSNVTSEAQWFGKPALRAGTATD